MTLDFVKKKKKKLFSHDMNVKNAVWAGKDKAWDLAINAVISELMFIGFR